jgi:hypothetical protein
MVLGEEFLAPSAFFAAQLAFHAGNKVVSGLLGVPTLNLFHEVFCFVL